MKYALYAAAALLATSMASPASAQVTIEENNGQLNTHVNADDGIGKPADATTKYGTTDKNDPLAHNNVLFDADTAISITGGGFALIEDADNGKDGVQDFYQLIVNPDDAFKQIDFSLQFNGAASYFTVEYDLLGDALGFIYLDTLFQDSGLSDYLIDGNGLVFDSIRLTSVAGLGVATPTTIDFEKQNSLTLGSASLVPEPSVWAMMLLGFGGLGMQIRRRRARNAGLALA